MKNKDRKKTNGMKKLSWRKRYSDSFMGGIFLVICTIILCSLVIISKILIATHEESKIKKIKPDEIVIDFDDDNDNKDDDYDSNYDEDGNYIFDYNDSYAWIFPGMSLEAKKSTVFPQDQIQSFMDTYVKHEDSLPLRLVGRNFDNSVTPYDGVERTITCWGDSMTEGNGTNPAVIEKDGETIDISYITYPMFIEQTTGIKTYNLGVGGETSKQIAERQGGLPIVLDRDVTIPESGAMKINLISPDDEEPVYFNDYSGYGFSDEPNVNKVYIGGQPYKITFNGETHILYKNLKHKTKENESTTSVSTQTNSSGITLAVGTPVYTKAAIDRKNDILIIEMGSNGGWDDDLSELVAQYDAMINSAGCKYYIIIGDTDDPYYDAGVGETAWEATLHEAFGEHFINMRLYLIEHGLSDCGLETTFADMEGYCNGEISKQLRADWTHLNAYGYYSKGLAVYQKGVQLGYWS